MMEHTLQALSREIPKPFTSTEEAVDCHHNYVQQEEHFGENVWVTRKGAVSAKKGQMGIIPGSMGARSFIVRSEEHTSELQSRGHLVCRLLLEKKKRNNEKRTPTRTT